MKNRKNKIKEFDERLLSHIKHKDFVKIYRTGTDGAANISGFIIQMSDEFLLLQNEEEFFLNGYSIIRKERFDSIRMDETELFQRKILESEGIISLQHGLKEEINLASLSTIFSDLKKKDYYVIVECEDLEESTFTIGEISNSTRESVGIRYFAPDGVIEKEPTNIEFKDITLIKFDDRYTKLYRKYLTEEE